MRKLIIGLLVFGVTAQAFAQDPMREHLSEIFLIATNYKYLDQTDAPDSDISIEQLQRKVATFDIKKSDVYQDEYDFYTVSFYIPDGKILAAYDKDGQIIRSAERYKKMNLPAPVVAAVMNRFPKWTIAKDLYLVNYHEKAGVKKRYKLTLENGDERLRVKLDDKGNFL